MEDIDVLRKKVFDLGRLGGDESQYGSSIVFYSWPDVSTGYFRWFTKVYYLIKHPDREYEKILLDPEKEFFYEREALLHLIEVGERYMREIYPRYKEEGDREFLYHHECEMRDINNKISIDEINRYGRIVTCNEGFGLV